MTPLLNPRVPQQPISSVENSDSCSDSYFDTKDVTDLLKEPKSSLLVQELTLAKGIPERYDDEDKEDANKDGLGESPDPIRLKLTSNRLKP